MARALRSGDFTSLPSIGRTTALSQQSGDSYAPDPSDLAVTAGRTAAAAALKRGAAGIRMYDPKAGEDVGTSGEVTGKHRMKHQINQLAANAAALEAFRAAHDAGGSRQTTVKGSSTRANAKKRYGW